MSTEEFNKTVVMQMKFENWILNAIPDFDEKLLLGFDKGDGYTKSETVNAMWVGFCGALLSSSQ